MDKDKQVTPEQTTPPDPQVAPVPGQKVQYVITQHSLNGIGGWLLFFLVIFTLIGIGSIGLFFDGLDKGISTAAETIEVVFAPLLAVGFLASVVLIAMRKKVAVMATYVSIAVMALYSAMSTLVSNDDESDSLAIKISGILIAFVFYGLFALYFKQSRRVKETLIK
jgi:hypothetical protein